MTGDNAYALKRWEEAADSYRRYLARQSRTPPSATASA